MLLYQEQPYLEPQKVFDFVCDFQGSILLHSSMLHTHYGRFSFIVINPVEVYTEDNINIAIEKWKNLFKSNVQNCDLDFVPFTGGLVGFLSYELHKELEPSVTKNSKKSLNISKIENSDIPNYLFGLYNQIIAFDHYQQKCYLIVAKIKNYNLNYNLQLQNLLKIYNKATILTSAQSSIITRCDKKSTKLDRLKSNFTKSEYTQIVDKAIKYITEGDIFEVNLSQCYSTNFNVNYSCKSLYSRLSKINSAPFTAYLNCGDLRILSASPERFLSVRKGVVEARPIKGTINRSLVAHEDANLKKKLLNSQKDVAENIMIVDLMRSDLSKICTPDSVNVSQLCEVESFTNVHHLVSVINGKLKANKTIFDIISAVFPSGSITGAPKIRAMQIIEELERLPRGVYCGSIGYFGFNGNVDLSVAIRTIVQKGNKISFGVGGAVTLNSDSIGEYNESVLKGQKLMEALLDSSY